MLAVTAGYVLGSIPFPYLLGQLRGQDLFEVGSRNPGAANLFRKVSRPLGVAASILDIWKGATAVLFARWLGLPPELTIVAGGAAMAGHWYSLFLRFRGGEALATVVGVGVGALPQAALAAIGAGLVILALIRSMGHTAALAWPVFVAVASYTGATWQEVLWVTLLLVIVTTRARIRGRRERRRPAV